VLEKRAAKLEEQGASDVPMLVQLCT